MSYPLSFKDLRPGRSYRMESDDSVIIEVKNDRVIIKYDDADMKVEPFCCEMKYREINQQDDITKIVGLFLIFYIVFICLAIFYWMMM